MSYPSPTFSTDVAKPAMDYPPPSQYNVAKEREAQGSTTMTRNVIGGLNGLCVFSVALAVFLVVTFIVITVSFPDHPKFTINSFSVSNFNASFPGFTGNWAADLTIENKNARFKVIFDTIESSVYYPEDKGAFALIKNHLLASEFSDPFSMERKASNTMHVEPSFNMGKTMIESEAVDLMAKERDSGKVGFILRVHFRTRYEPKSWTSEKTLTVRCPINIVFHGATGNGTADPESLD
ncbi:unnamed protein product [Dovyalis caffra]|uniref:Late embryogenesis abundant protein LEA-2 subgroup domain-containing protein n=1 Tax=Dovyalis caffra TaxID=77055 RepID=A0AAV1SRY4_9ROSI|nr:unnamed protein product [Dovyalis caffra]